MDFNFGTALAKLGTGAAVRIANELRPPSTFVFNQILPERNLGGYVAEAGNMTVRSTMAGLAAMDSPYPPSGRVEASDFMQGLAKVANEVMLSEKAQRQLQDRFMRLGLSTASGTEAMIQEVLNFTVKALLQPHLDTAEWLRGQALQKGVIDWTFNKKRLYVDYGFTGSHLLAKRTTAGSADAYNLAGSAFWDDVRTAKRLLRYNLRMVVAHPDTIDAIVSNASNNLVMTAQTGTVTTVKRLIAGVGGGQVESSDARDGLTFISYQEEGEMIDPSDPDGPTLKVPFMNLGTVLFIGDNKASGYRVGEGATRDPEADRALGYTHVGPTVEADGAVGRWSDVFTPERKRYQLVGQAVTNLLPVIDAPDKIVVANTELS